MEQSQKPVELAALFGDFKLQPVELVPIAALTASTDPDAGTALVFDLAALAGAVGRVMPRT